MEWKKYDAFFSWMSNRNVHLRLSCFFCFIVYRESTKQFKVCVQQRIGVLNATFFLVDEFRIKNNNDDRHFSSRDEERKRNQSSSSRDEERKRNQSSFENRLNIQNKISLVWVDPSRTEPKLKWKWRECFHLWVIHDSMFTYIQSY